MVVIEEILQLPKEEQIAIMHAIQDNLGDFGEEEDDEGNEEVSDEIIAFVEARVNKIKASNEPTYTWQHVKEELKAQKNMK